MKRDDLIDVIAEAAEITKKKANDVLDSVLKSITASLSKGDDVALIGFGTFSVKKRAARTGVNPQTRQQIQIAASNVPSFKAGKLLKEACNADQEAVN